PFGASDYFDVVDVKESLCELTIYLEEKNLVPEERQITTREQMLDEMCATLGGRAAEDDVWVGANAVILPGVTIGTVAIAPVRCAFFCVP
ncbi:hypothetical protein, partial [Bacteroides sp. 214]|uniref:hypothetical protein n=1 Tax=Bacteroides sp. 214 TaxID=2302935 RepID=UPI0013D662DB